MIKLSIVVPIYNVELYLNDCLTSLINQTLKEIEIICINDGSKDNSLAILKEFAKKDNRIIIIDKKNEGQSIARNIGVEVAEGEFLGFVDADDTIDLDYFEKLYNTAKSNNCDIACAGYRRFSKKKTIIKKSYSEEIISENINEKIQLDNLPYDNYIWNKIYKREVWIKEKLVFPAGRYFEDIALVIKLLHTFKRMVTVPNVYYNYRINPLSTVNQKNFKHKYDYKWAMNELYEYAKNNNIYIDKSDLIDKKVYYKLGNFTLLKIYYYESKVIYKLLGFIPFIKKLVV